MKNTLTQYDTDLENILQQVNQNRYEPVRRSYPDEPALFGIRDFDYVGTSPGPEICQLLPNEDWTKNKGPAQFISFRDDILFIPTKYEGTNSTLEG